PRRSAPRADRPFEKRFITRARLGEAHAGFFELGRQPFGRFSVAVTRLPPAGQVVPALCGEQVHERRVDARSLPAVSGPVPPPPRGEDVDLSEAMDDSADGGSDAEN